jgi:8-oxo-dGTP diphosphatase
MSLFPVALCVFYRWQNSDTLEVWVQNREDDGPYHGLLEFPGGGIEAGELPLAAAVREVEEEVGIKIDPDQGKLMGIYSNESSKRTILLYVFLFPESPDLDGRGQWLTVKKEALSSLFQGMIPGPNHRIIDDLFNSLYDNAHE